MWLARSRETARPVSPSRRATCSARSTRCWPRPASNKSKLVAVNVFLPNIADFDAMNVVYDGWIDPANPAARACVEARLADPDLRVEMTAVALL